MAVCTWAPRGKTPVLRVPLTRDHLSAISGITFDSRLFLQVRQASYDAAAVVGAPRACSCARFRERSSLSGMAHPFIAGTRSKTFSSEEQPNACI